MCSICFQIWITNTGAVGTHLLGLWTLARVRPIEIAPAIGAAMPLVGALVLLSLAIRARPSLGETALAVDRAGHDAARAVLFGLRRFLQLVALLARA